MANTYNPSNQFELYDQLNVVNSSYSPSTVHVKNTRLTQYFVRYLLQKAQSVFRYTLPKHWSRVYFLNVLYCWGYLAVVRTDKFGVIPQACGLMGYNVFYQPRQAVISNPLIAGIKTPVIGEECTVIRMQQDYGGLMDIVSYYADLMALTAEAMGVNLINSKLSYVFTAKNKAAAESVKKMYDKIQGGEPAVVVDDKLFATDGTPVYQFLNQDVGGNFIADKLLQCLRQIENQFATDIGIPNANTDKKERLVVDEVNANNVETMTRCDMWLDTLQECMAQTRDLFGLDQEELNVEWRVDPTLAPDQTGGVEP